MKFKLKSDHKACINLSNVDASQIWPDVIGCWNSDSESRMNDLRQQVWIFSSLNDSKNFYIIGKIIMNNYSEWTHNYMVITVNSIHHEHHAAFLCCFKIWVAIRIIYRAMHWCVWVMCRTFIVLGHLLISGFINPYLPLNAWSIWFSAMQMRRYSAISLSNCLHANGRESGFVLHLYKNVALSVSQSWHSERTEHRMNFFVTCIWKLFPCCLGWTVDPVKH